MKWISLIFLLSLTGCTNPDNSIELFGSIEPKLIWVKIWLTEKWFTGQYKTRQQVDAFLDCINTYDNRYDDRLIKFGDFYVNKEQIKAIRIG